MFKRFTAFLMMIVFLCSPVYGGYVEDNTPSPAVASVGGEWALIGMLGSGSANESVKAAYLSNLKAKLDETDGILSARRYTEYSRAVIALNLLGETADDFMGYNIVSPLLNSDNVGKQGINGIIFALIALTGGNYGTAEYRNELLNTVLNAQSTDGYFEYGGSPNADVTAMALCALAPYSDRQEVKSAIDRAVDALGAMIDDNGLILTDGVYSSETVSQVIIGLSAVGVDAETDSRFVRNGSGLVTALGGFSVGGGYAHLAGDKVNPMASEQGLCATAAYNLYKKGSQPLYYPENFEASEEISPVSVLDRLLEVILYEK